MTTTRRTIVNTGAASLVAMTALRATPAQSLAQEGTPTPPSAGTQPAMEPVLRPGIDQIAAQEAALSGQSGVAVNSVKLQRANGTLYYEVDLSNGDEVFIDAATGQILPMTMTMTRMRMRTTIDHAVGRATSGRIGRTTRMPNALRRCRTVLRRAVAGVS